MGFYHSFLTSHSIIALLYSKHYQSYYSRYKHDRCQDDKQYCSYHSYKLAYPCFVAGIYTTTYEILAFARFRINYSITALSIASIHLLPSLYRFLFSLFLPSHLFHPPLNFFNSSMLMILQSGSIICTSPRLTAVPSILIFG